VCQESWLDFFASGSVEPANPLSNRGEQNLPPVDGVTGDRHDIMFNFNSEYPIHIWDRMLRPKPCQLRRAGGVLRVLARGRTGGPTAGYRPQLPRIGDQHVLALKRHRVVIRQSHLLLLG
jgi:hypothetical protein